MATIPFSGPWGVLAFVEDGISHRGTCRLSRSSERQVSLGTKSAWALAVQTTLTCCNVT